MGMRFLWRPWKKTPIRKKIRVAYYSHRTINEEEIVLSYKGENYRLICFCTGRDGNLQRRHKKHTRISSYHLGKVQIEIEKFNSRPNYSLDGFRFMVIDFKIIQELRRDFSLYFRNCGIEDEEFGDVRI